MKEQDTTEETSDFKVKEVLSDSGPSAFQKYKGIYHGNVSIGRVLLCEIVVTLFSWIPGALGLALRGIFYRFMFGSIGRKVIFGKDVTLRHPHKVHLGNNVVIDDNCVIDAKGDSNTGIVIGNNVYIGRNTIVYCKNGDISFEDNVNISSNCQIFSCNKLTIGRDTVVGAFSYFLSGGEYDIDDATPFAQQSGTNTKGALTIGPNCWVAARVTILDAANVGEHCVLGAGAVLNKPIPAHSVAVGIPAKVVKHLSVTESTSDGL